MGVENCGGEVVKEWSNHFLRDDLEIRFGTIDPPQAYSLFRIEPYGRVQVFAGPIEWALPKAEAVIFSNDILDEDQS